MSDLWTTRDLPVLRYLVERLDAMDSHRCSPEEVAESTGLELDAVQRAFRNLYEATPRYLDGITAAQAAYPIAVTRVTERAYRAVGAWPTAEGLADSIADAFDRAAEEEPDPERKSKLKATGSWLGGAGRSIAVDVMTRFVERQAGLG